MTGHRRLIGEQSVIGLVLTAQGPTFIQVRTSYEPQKWPIGLYFVI
jgi:hypothetical protein